MVDARKVNSVVPPVAMRDNELVRFRSAFRQAIEAKSQHGLKLAAIVAHMRARGCDGVDEPYLYKLYSGARPLTDAYIVALPDEVNAVFYSLLAEQHDGQMVIRPATGIDGVRQFASGLYGFMQELSKLPARETLPTPGGVTAKACLRAPKAKSRTAAGGPR